jgi:hypothetical protein
MTDKEIMVFVDNNTISPLQKEILSFATTWMNLEDTMLSEIRQTQKDKYYVISYVESKRNKQKQNKIVVTKNRWWTDGWGEYGCSKYTGCISLVV